MTVDSTILLAFACIDVLVAVYYMRIALTRPKDREYGSWAVVAGGSALFSLGASLRACAEEPADLDLASRILFIGGAVSLGGYVVFAEHLSTVPRKLVRRLARWWLVAGVVLAGGGLLADPNRITGDYGFETLALLPAGAVWLVVGLGLLVANSVHLLRHRREARSHVMAAMAVIASVSVVHDLLKYFLPLHTPFVTEYVAFGALEVTSFALLYRFLAEDDELARRTRELARSHDALRELQAAIVAKQHFAAIGELSRVVAHEIRNPLAILKNAASGLRRKPSPADEKVLIAIIDEESRRLDLFVRDLGTFSRPVTPTRSRVELQSLLARAFTGASARVKSHDVTPEIEVETEHSVYCDPELVTSAVQNVIVNALEAMPLGGTLKLSASNATLDGRAAVTIRIGDTGEGMDTLVREKAVAPFFTTKPTGAGLGLAIVDQVVRAHGGELAISSRYGVGTVVSMTLPAST
jgi:signal transduction histidine kinase